MSFIPDLLKVPSCGEEKPTPTLRTVNKLYWQNKKMTNCCVIGPWGTICSALQGECTVLLAF
jgi:hypothetical protein